MATTNNAKNKAADMKLEIVVIPVSDVDRERRSTRSSGGGSTRTSPRGTISA